MITAKKKAIDYINSSLSMIEPLKEHFFDSIIFKKWERGVLISLQYFFGPRHEYVLKFKELFEIKKDLYYFFTQKEIQALHLKNLDEAKMFLETVLNEIEIFWDEEKSFHTNINFEQENSFMINLDGKLIISPSGKEVKLPEEISTILIDFIKNSDLS
ncbi:hypothetical protein JXR93_11475 [bacterium]|nr:hypothetical protein [bacterium]